MRARKMLRYKLSRGNIERGKGLASHVFYLEVFYGILFNANSEKQIQLPSVGNRDKCVGVALLQNSEEL